MKGVLRPTASIQKFSLLLILLTILVDFSMAVDTRDFYPPFWSAGGKQYLNSSTPYGEPLNIIISGRSHPDVLSDFGIQWYSRSLGFSQECLGFHAGKPFQANLGDGNGWKDVLAEMRQDYSNGLIGTCLETFVGGNHFRIARQDGPLANTSALFLAASLEEDLSKEHTVSPNGYDLARDIIVARATNTTTSYGGVVYEATVESVAGLYDGGDDDNHRIRIDNIVHVLTVNIVDGEDFLKGTRGVEPADTE